MGVRYMVVPTGVEAVPEGRVVASADDYDLVQVYGWEPRVSLVDTWAQVDGPADALNGVLDPSFDPARTAYVEQDPGISPTASATPGTAEYREVTPEDVRITVTSDDPALVVVRNSYDPAVRDRRRRAGAGAGDRLPRARCRGPIRNPRDPAGLPRRRRDEGRARRTSISAMLLLSIGVTLIWERR